MTDRDHLPATTGTADLPVVTSASYDELVRSNLLRYQGVKTDIPGEVVGVLPSDPTLVEQHRVLMSGPFASEGAADGLVISFIAAGVGACVTTTQAAAGNLALLYVYIAWALMLGIGGAFTRYGFASDRRKALANDIVESRIATVPLPVADAYSRLASAAHEVGQDTEEGESSHSTEAIATIRLAADGARDIVTLLHHHNAAGTIHSDAARSLTSEIYRLASEVDAYLTLHNAQRFAPGEDDAFGVIAATSQLTLQPREIES